MPSRRPFALALAVLALGLRSPAVAGVVVDLSGYRDDCGVSVLRDGDSLAVSWPLTDADAPEHGRLVLDLRGGAHPLIASLGIAAAGAGEAEAVPIVKAADPVTFLSVGIRVNSPDRPPGMSVDNVFFDSPAKRGVERYRAELDLKTARVTGRSHGGRATVSLGDLTAGRFAGALELTVYKGARLVHVEAVLTNPLGELHQLTRPRDTGLAFLYDAGLASAAPSWSHTAWYDTEGELRRKAFGPATADHALTVRHRAIVAESPGGSIACFPPPHQFFYPRDFTDNQSTVWAGRDHRGLTIPPGFGVRQSETGGGNYAPWFNSPPGTTQRLGVFYLLSRGKADDALRETLRYTHGDRFPDLRGHVTFTSHWHMALTMAAMAELAEKAPRTTPDAVKMFKDMNVNVVHLAEFHGDGHPQDQGTVRLRELRAMFDECDRLSDDSLLFLPGEEANVDFEGHWLYLFPRPVFWIWSGYNKGDDPPFRTVEPGYGPVYRVSSKSMPRLLREEHGLAWTAHPRIKASNWTPDAYRDADFFRSDDWLGAAWKAMPADLSQPRLGARVLDLLDDMANWGAKKYAPGEVDVFKIDHTHELYGHMNVNYLRLDHAPRFADDWSPVLDALRHGAFFVTTGEVLLTDFTVGGLPSGSTLTLPAGGRPPVKISLDWTFPLRFAEVVSGDGHKVYRDRVDLSAVPPFSTQTLDVTPDLTGRTWVRVEAWDVAANGTFSQPVWLEPAPAAE